VRAVWAAAQVDVFARKGDTLSRLRSERSHGSPSPLGDVDAAATFGWGRWGPRLFLCATRPDTCRNVSLPGKKIPGVIFRRIGPRAGKFPLQINPRDSCRREVDDPKATQGALRVRALVAGYSARVVARILDSPHVANLVSNLRPELRAELHATTDAIRRAAADFDLAEQGRFAHAKPLGYEVSGAQAGSVGMGTGAAARDGYRCRCGLLGVSRRRVQQLAAAGLGVKVDGRWVLDRAAIEAYRRSA
jgi:hypothetical protein